MKRAAIYARISLDRTGQQAGVERQQAECRELATRLGWEVTGSPYIDNDISAYNGKARPEYKRLLGDLKLGTVDAILAWHPDRLYRRTEDLLELIQIAEKAPIATVTAGTIDLSNASGKLVAKLLADVGHFEVEHASERQKLKDKAMAAEGRHHGGSRPYGYRYPGNKKPLVIVPREAAVIRELADRCLAGESLHELTRDLNRRQVPTSRGTGSWHHQTLNRLLMSPQLAGLRSYHGEIVRTGDWPPILTLDQHRQLEALLTDPSRRTNRSPRKYLLTGIAKCGLCGSGLMARPKWDKRRNYLCRSCGKIGALAEPLEKLITEAVLKSIEGPDFDAQLRESRAPSGEAAALEAQMQELADLWAERQISKAEWLAAREPLQRRLEQQRKEEANQVRSIQLDAFEGHELRAAWPGLDISRQRTIVRAMVDSITVRPAVRGRNTFDGGRVDIKWRV